MVHSSMIRTVRVMALASALAVTALAQHVQAAGSALPAGTFAVVNGVALPQTQLDTVLHNITSRTGQGDTPQRRAQVRQDLIAHELLRQAAQKANYGSRPEVQAVMVDAQVQLYAKEHIQPQPVTDAQVQSRYDAIIASLGKEEFRKSLIAVADEAAAQKVMVALKSGQDFATLARQVSVAPSRAAGGALPWVSFPVPAIEGKTQGLPLPLAKAISALPVGGVSPQLLQVDNAWVIVKLDEKRPMQAPTFDQAKGGIRQQLQAQAQQTALAELNASLLKAATVQQ